MATVFIPPQLRELTAGTAQVEVDAKSVRQVIAELDERYPGIGVRLQDEDRLQPGLAVSIDGVIQSQGLFAQVSPESEVHFLPAFGGG